MDQQPKVAAAAAAKIYGDMVPKYHASHLNIKGRGNLAKESHDIYYKWIAPMAAMNVYAINQWGVLMPDGYRLERNISVVGTCREAVAPSTWRPHEDDEFDTWRPDAGQDGRLLQRTVCQHMANHNIKREDKKTAKNHYELMKELTATVPPFDPPENIRCPQVVEEAWGAHWQKIFTYRRRGNSIQFRKQVTIKRKPDMPGRGFLMKIYAADKSLDALPWARGGNQIKKSSAAWRRHKH